jgi:hypothetical protein
MNEPNKRLAIENHEQKDLVVYGDYDPELFTKILSRVSGEGTNNYTKLELFALLDNTHRTKKNRLMFLIVHNDKRSKVFYGGGFITRKKLASDEITASPKLIMTLSRMLLMTELETRLIDDILRGKKNIEIVDDSVNTLELLRIKDRLIDIRDSHKNREKLLGLKSTTSLELDRSAKKLLDCPKPLLTRSAMVAAKKSYKPKPIIKR